MKAVELVNGLSLFEASFIMKKKKKKRKKIGIGEKKKMRDHL